MNTPSDVAFLTDGSLVIADRLNDRVRRVTTGGQMQTAAGGGSCGGPPCGDGGQADDAELSQPRGVTSLLDGGYLVTGLAGSPRPPRAAGRADRHRGRVQPRPER